jgi:hypothetical protein
MEMATPWTFLPRPVDRDLFGAEVRDPKSMRRRFAYRRYCTLSLGKRKRRQPQRR